MKDYSKRTTDFPSKAHTLNLVAFGPEKIEEEGRSEDECHKNASKYIVRRCSDIVVIEFRDSVVADFLDFLLLVGVVYSKAAAVSLKTRYVTARVSVAHLIAPQSRATRSPHRISMHIGRQ